MIAVRELDSGTLKDFETLFSKHHGASGGCWCVYHKMTMGEYIRSTKEERYRLHRALAEKGESRGVLVYDGDLAVAWCQYGPASSFPAFDKGRNYPALSLPEELKPAWRITCVFTDRDRRREGWAKIALKGAVDSIAHQGGGIVESFPLDLPGAKAPAYTGSVAMYEELGFVRIAPIGKNHQLMRANILSAKG